MSKTAIEVITSVQRRRRWTAEQKERLGSGVAGAWHWRVRGGSPSWDTLTGPLADRAHLLTLRRS
jgi:hypothetical protein